MGNSNSRRVFLVLMTVAVGLVAYVLSPFVEALIFALVMAATLFPLHRKLRVRLGDRPQLSAGLLCGGVVLAVLVPLGGLVGFAVNEAIGGAKFVADALQGDGMSGFLNRLPDSIRGMVTRWIESNSPAEGDLGESLTNMARQYSGRVASFLGGALTATGSMILQTIMMLIALFFFFTDGEELVAWTETNSPLRRGQVRELLQEFRKVSTSVVVSSTVTSGVQAVAALIGYLIAGVPRPAFFALLTFCVAFVPAIGAGAVCMIAALLVLLLGHTWAAVFLAVWGVAVVGVVDNLVKPILVKRGMHMHGGVVFFAFLGGVTVFGAVGLLLGPLIITFLLALVRIHARDYTDPLRSSMAPSIIPPVPDLPEEFIRDSNT